MDPLLGSLQVDDFLIESTLQLSSPKNINLLNHQLSRDILIEEDLRVFEDAEAEAEEGISDDEDIEQHGFLDLGQKIDDELESSSGSEDFDLN